MLDYEWLTKMRNGQCEMRNAAVAGNWWRVASEEMLDFGWWILDGGWQIPNQEIGCLTLSLNRGFF
jgi:hypothetical protein